MCKNISEYPYNYYINTDTYVTDIKPCTYIKHVHTCAVYVGDCTQKSHNVEWKIVRFLIHLTPLFCEESKCHLLDFKKKHYLNKEKPSVVAHVCKAFGGL